VLTVMANHNVYRPLAETRQFVIFSTSYLMLGLNR
jgi:hypothetical protein